MKGKFSKILSFILMCMLIVGIIPATNLITTTTAEAAEEPLILDENQMELLPEKENEGLLQTNELTTFSKGLRATPTNQQPVTEDGITIEKATMRWLSAPTGSDEPAKFNDLNLVPSNDNIPNQQWQFDLALSGKGHIEAGDLEIAIPAYIWKTRDGKEPGRLTLAVPEEPATSNDFAWKRVGDKIIITNTKKLSAASKYMIQGTFRMTYPDPNTDKPFTTTYAHEMNDIDTVGEAEYKGISDDLYGVVTVVTPENRAEISMTSNSIKATIDTHVEVTSVSKRAVGDKAFITNVPSNLPIELYPDGNPEDYVYVQWYIGGRVNGNQPYTLSISDTAENAYSCIMLGATNGEEGIKASQDGKTIEYKVYEGSTFNSEKSSYVWTAYPKSQFPDEGTVYTLNNNVTVKVKGVDDQIETTKNASAKVSFRTPITWRIKKVWEYNEDKYEATLEERIARQPTETPAWLVESHVSDARYDYAGNVWKDKLNDSNEWYTEWTDDGSIKSYKAYEYTKYITNSIHGLNGVSEPIVGGDLGERVYLPNGSSYQKRWWYDHHKTDYDEELHQWTFYNDYHEGVTWSYPNYFGKSALNHTNSDKRATSDKDLLLLSRNQETTSLDWSVTRRVGIIEATAQSGTDFTKEEELGKNYVKVEFLDDKITFAGRQLEPDEYYITDIYGINMDVQYYHPNGETGTFTTKSDEPVDIYGLVNGEWKKFGTKTGNNITAENGAKAENGKLIFPEKQVTQLKTVLRTNGAYVNGEWKFGLKLLPSEKIKEKIAADFQLDNYVINIVSNTATFTVMTDDEQTVLDRVSASATEYLHGRNYRLAVDLDKTTTYKVNNRETRNLIFSNTIALNRMSDIPTSSEFDWAIEEGLLPDSKSGTFIDLLPAGMLVDKDTITISNGNIKTINVLDNYKNSGRQLVLIKADLENKKTTGVGFDNNKRNDDTYPDIKDYGWAQTVIKFDMNYSYDEAKNRGLTGLRNTAAYTADEEEFGNMPYWSGETDAPIGDNHKETLGAVREDLREIMSDLTDSEGPATVYAGADVRTTEVNFAALTHLQKHVATQGSDNWTYGLDNEVNVPEGGKYSYRIVLTSATDTTTKDIIILDSLETYVPKTVTDSGDSGIPVGKTISTREFNETNEFLRAAGLKEIQAEDVWRWQGYFRGIDVSEIEAMGVKPIVYYNTTKNLDILGYNPDNDYTSVENTLTSSWTTTPPEDLSTVTAVAIDCRKKADGSDFELKENEALIAYINMKAPIHAQQPDAFDEEEYNNYLKNAHAFNNVFMDITQIDDIGLTTHSYDHFDYTQVGIYGMDMVVEKKWEDDDDNDCIRPNNVKVKLYANGEDTGRSVQLNNDTWSGLFDHVLQYDDDDKAIDYTLVEEKIEGYTSTSTVTQDGVNLKATLVNKHDNYTTEFPFKKQWESNELGDWQVNIPKSVTIRLLKDGVFTGQTKIITEADEWKGTFENLQKFENGELINYSVKESISNSDFKVSMPDEHTILNTYYPYGNISIKKTALNTTDVSIQKEFTFVINLAEGEEAFTGEVDYEIKKGNDVIKTSKIGNGGEFKLKDGEEMYVKDVPSGVRYVVTENPLNGFTNTNKSNATGTVRADKDAEVVFENTYHANGNVSISAIKTLTGTDLKRGAFRFKLYNSEGTVLRSVSNTAEGNVNFGNLNYTEADSGKEFVYTIKEDNTGKPGYIYSDKTFTVKTYPKDNGDGTMSVDIKYFDGNTEVTPEFKNEYHADGKIALKAFKELKGRTLKENEFEFELLDEEGNVIQTKKNDANGLITFDELEFNETHVGKTFNYIVKEKKGNDNTVNYDDSEYAYTVFVVDNGDGTLSFTQDSTKIKYELTKEDNYYIKVLNINTRGERGEDYNSDQNLPDTINGRIISPMDGDVEIKETDELDGGTVNDYIEVVRYLINNSPDYTLEDMDSDNRIKFKEEPYWWFSPNRYPYGLSYTVVDADAIYMCFHGGLKKVIGDEPTAPIFKNTLKPGSFSVTKTVQGENPNPNQKFKFKVKLTGEDEINLDHYTLKQADTTTGNANIIPSVNIPNRIETGEGRVAKTKKVEKEEGLFEKIGGFFEDVFLGEEVKAEENYDSSAEAAKGVFHATDDMLWGEAYAVYDTETRELMFFRDEPGKYTNGYLENGKRYFTGVEEENALSGYGYPSDPDTLRKSLSYSEYIHVKPGHAIKPVGDFGLYYTSVGVNRIDFTGIDTSLITNLIFAGNYNTPQTDWGKDGFAEIIGLERLDTSNMATVRLEGSYRTGYGLRYLINLETLDLSNWTGESITSLSSFLQEQPYIKKLILSNFNTPNLENAYSMFKDCISLEILDLSCFDTSKVTNMRWMFYGCYNLKEITIGPNFKFEGDNIENVSERAIFPTPPNNSEYTGKWILEDSDLPAMTPEELRDNYDGATMAGTWVWERRAVDYNIFFSSTDSLVSGSMANETANVSEEFTIPTNTFVKFGYEFDHWEDGNGNTYTTTIPANKYAAGETVTLTPVFVPRNTSINMVDGEFEFEIKAGETALFENIPAGTSYQVYEETSAGWVLVSESDTSGIIQPLAESKAKFTNEYNPNKTNAKLNATKLLDGKVADADMFEFELYEDNTLIEKKKNTTGGAIVFSPIEYTSTGKHTYTIKEVTPNAKYSHDTHTETVTVDVQSKDGALTSIVTYDSDGVVFNNTTKPGSLKIHKNIIGTDNIAQEFKVDVTLIDNNNPEGVTTRHTLKSTEDLIISDIPDGTRYEVKEVEIPHGWTLTSENNLTGTITSNTEASVSFTNSYSAEGFATITAHKELVGERINEGEFRFELRDENDRTISTATNGEIDIRDTIDEEGTVNEFKNTAPITFEAITYNKPGTYKYKIVEIPGNDATINYDTKEIPVTVYVTDTNDGYLDTRIEYDNNTFTNEKKKGSLTILKNISNGNSDEFKFTLTLNDTNGNEINDTYTGTFADGSTVDIKSGQEFTISSNNLLTINNLPHGATYSIEESEKEGWELVNQTEAEGIIEADKTKNATFTNVYSATGELQIEVDKTLEGANIADNTFTFALTDENGNVIATAETDVNGHVEFPVIGYTQEDANKRFVYYVKEVQDERNMTWDDHSVEYVVDVTDDGKGKMIANVTKTGEETFHNELTGSLTLMKVLTGPNQEPTKDFEFTIELDDKSITGKYGDVTFTDGKAIVKIRGGQAVNVTGLPKTKYTVTEKDYSLEGYVTTKENDTGDINPGQNAECTFTNERLVGDLEISKTVTGTKKPIDANDLFEFIITLSIKINHTYSDAEFKDGVAIIKLKDGETKTISGLPAAIKFAIEEQQRADYSLENKTGDSGDIVANDKKSSSFTNLIEKYGDLEVSKTISGDGVTEADRNRKYQITVELSDKTINGTFGDMEFANGIATLNLAPGEKATAVSLPKNITYEITEADYTAFGFESVYTNKTGTIPVNDKIKASVDNKKTTGNLEIEKVLTGQKKEVDTSKKFEFTITLSNKEYNETLSGVTFTNGVAKVNLADTEKKLIENIPTGITYTITEEDYAPDYVIEEKTNDTGDIKANETVSSKWTNRVEKYGDVKVEKIITGALNDYDRSKAFNITVTLSDKTINGTFGDMTFENGVAKIALKGGETATATGLPKNTKYTVTEDNYTHFGFATDIQGNSEIVPNTEKEVTVTNDKTVGNLSISKSLTGWIKDVDRQKEFKYTITLSNKEISGTFGDITFKDGIATTTLKDGEVKEATALPTGITYTVVEDDYTSEKYILEKKENDKGPIIKDTTSEAKFTNRVEKYGSLRVKKEVEGALQDEFNNVYSFTVTLSDNTVNGTFGDMTFKDGVATFTLKAGETATAHQIPSDLTYKVQEEDYRSIGFKTEYIRQKGTIPRNNTTTSFVKNIRETGDLNLTKINDGGDKNKEFEFIVRIKNKSFSGVYGDMTFYKGEARVKIKGGQTVKAFNLPAETQYEVIEADYINDGYFTNSENATGTIKADAVQRPKFTNVYRTGTLNIAKTSNGNDYHKDREFTFKVTITKPDGTFTKNATYGGINYTTENGNLVTTVKVKEGQSVKLTDIPDTFLYKVEEIEANKDGYVTAVTDNEGVIDNGKTTIVAFTNTRDTFGDLTVTKEGIGDGVLASKVFTIRVTLSDRTITGTYGDMEFTDGVADIKVKAGESKTATKLPNGITYNIEELNANLYKVTYENKTGTIKGNSKVSAKVINEKDLPPIEKKVEGKEHHDLPKRGDTFTYTISTEIPDGAHDFRITDTLVDELAFGENVKVTIDEKEVETDIRKTGQTLICNLTKEQIEENAGKTITIEFDAKIDSDDLSKYLIGEDIRVPNKANYLINNSIEKESNTVTITPPLPEPPIEKFVNEKKHEDLADYDEIFKYKVVTQIPEDALEFEINDTLEPVLEFANENAIVKIDGKETTVNTSFDGQHIKTVFDEETLKSNRCKEVTLEFEAKIKEDADVLQYLNKDNVILIPNKASYTINNSFTTNKVTKESDKVTVTPPITTPEPVKFVNDKEHEDLKTYEEEFVYKVETIIPRGAYKFVLTDKVVDELYIKEGTVKVEIDGKDFGNDTENTSTEENTVTLEDETPDDTASLTESDVPQKEGKVVVDGNLVTVTLDKDDLSKYFNKKLILTFTAGIREDADILKYTDENGKILIPNKAEYIINNNPNMIKETNTVTVTPPVTEPEIIKYVNDKEHEDLKTKDEIFTYRVVTEVPRGTDKYILSDILVDELEFIKDSAICKIGEDTVDVKVDGQKVYVELSKEQLGKYFNKPIELTFDAKIREGADVSKYMVDGKVKVPNTASYETRTSKKDSNTVTVTPLEDVIIPEDIPEKVITPSNPTKETTPSSPPTGNPSFIPLAIILSAISAGAVIAIVVMGRKKRR